jgi:hypothetical protein
MLALPGLQRREKFRTLQNVAPKEKKRPLHLFPSFSESFYK